MRDFFTLARVTSRPDLAALATAKTEVPAAAASCGGVAVPDAAHPRRAPGSGSGSCGDVTSAAGTDNAVAAAAAADGATGTAVSCAVTAPAAGSRGAAAAAAAPSAGETRTAYFATESAGPASAGVPPAAAAQMARRTPDDHMRFSSYSFAVTEQVSL